MAWGVAEAWAAASATVADAYGLDPSIIRATSEGRGYRPPARARVAKKRALWLTIVLTGCDYAELARVVQLHRDTVASHCADIRDQDFDDQTELSGAGLEAIARARAELMGMGLFMAENPARHRREALRQKLLKLSRDIQREARKLENLSGYEGDNPTLNPTQNEPDEKKISIPPTVYLIDVNDREAA